MDQTTTEAAEAAAADPAIVAAVLASLRGPAPTFNIENPNDPQTQLAQVVAHARHQGHDVPEGSYEDNLTGLAVALGMDPRLGAGNLVGACVRLGIYVAGVRPVEG